MFTTAEVDPHRPVRVAFYRRVSTREQDTDGFSLDGQLYDLNRYVELKAYKNWVTSPVWDFAEQASGASLDRPALQELLGLVRRKEVDIVLVWKIDRMSRSLPQLLDVFDFLSKNDVGFASVKEDIDFTGPIGRLIFQIFGAIAEFERENIRIRTEEGKKTSARAGNWVGGSAPFGFEKVQNLKDDGTPTKGKKLRIVEEEADWVRQMFDWFVYDRKTFVDIADLLNAKGVRRGKAATARVRGKPWWDSSVREILQNDLYRGLYIANRYRLVSSKPKKQVERPQSEWIMSRVPAIVDELLFTRAAQRMAEKELGRRGGGSTQYLLQGKLVDMATGKRFVGYRSGKGTKNYRRKQFRRADGTWVPSCSFAAKDVEQFVWQHIQMAVTNPERFVDVHRSGETRSQTTERLQQELRATEDALTKATRKLQLVESDYYEERIDNEKRTALLRRFTPERDRLFVRQQELERQVQALASQQVAHTDVVAFAERLERRMAAMSLEERKALVELVVDRVEILEEEHQRTARVLYRFDHAALSPKVEGGRTVLASGDARFSDAHLENKRFGAQPTQGYRFCFSTVIGIRNPRTSKFMKSDAMQKKIAELKLLAS